jgi:hypothetical protein
MHQLGCSSTSLEYDQDGENGHAFIQRQLPLRRDPILVRGRTVHHGEALQLLILCQGSLSKPNFRRDTALLTKNYFLHIATYVAA